MRLFLLRKSWLQLGCLLHIIHMSTCSYVIGLDIKAEQHSHLLINLAIETVSYEQTNKVRLGEESGESRNERSK